MLVRYCLCDGVSMKHKDDGSLKDNSEQIFVLPMNKVQELLNDENERLRKSLVDIRELLSDEIAVELDIITLCNRILETCDKALGETRK